MKNTIPRTTLNAAVFIVATILGGVGSVVGATAAVRWDLPYATASTGGVLLVAGVSVLLSAFARRR